MNSTKVRRRSRSSSRGPAIRPKPLEGSGGPTASSSPARGRVTKQIYNGDA